MHTYDFFNSSKPGILMNAAFLRFRIATASIPPLFLFDPLISSAHLLYRGLWGQWFCYILCLGVCYFVIKNVAYAGALNGAQFAVIS